MLHFKKITIIQLLAAVAFICLSAPQSYAISNTYVFTGIANISVSPELIPYGFQLDQTLTGSFTYDTAAVYPDPILQTNAYGTWTDNYEAVTKFAITIGSYTANGISNYDMANIIQVVKGFSAADDELGVGAPVNGPIINETPPYVALFLYTPMLDTDLAHVGDLNGAALESYSNWYISFGPNQEWMVSGRFTSIQRVPEPGILILLGISMMSVAGLKRRWKN